MASPCQPERSMRVFIIPILLSILLACGCVARQSGGEGSASKNALPAPVIAHPLSSSPVSAADYGTWQIQPGLLRAQLEKWSARAGYQVVWNVSRDYSIQNNTSFEGSFVDALTQLFTGLQQLGNSFKVTVYQGNRVVLVSEE